MDAILDLDIPDQDLMLNSWTDDAFDLYMGDYMGELANSATDVPYGTGEACDFLTEMRLRPLDQFLTRFLAVQMLWVHLSSSNRLRTFKVFRTPSRFSRLTTTGFQTICKLLIPL